MMQKQDQIDATSSYYDDMCNLWQMIQDLLGGTESMRRAGEKWTPREERESKTAYNQRVLRTTLFNGMRNAVRRAVTKPFSRPVTYREFDKLDPRLQNVLDDVDRTGCSMHDFSRKVFENGVKFGVTYVLVDFPKFNQEQPLTLKEERQLGARPILIHVTPPQLLGWRTERRMDGSTVLTEVRIHETRCEPIGKYTDAEVEYVRYFSQTEWQLWRKDPATDKWEVIEEGTHTFGEVPLFAFYTNQTGFMTGDPPFEDLAFLNVAHWNSSSQQELILSFSRMPLMFARGFSQEQIDDGIEIGPRRLIHTENERGELKYVEHTGAAIEAGERDLSKREEQMEVLGMQPFIQRSNSSTATGKIIDEGKNDSEAQSWVREQESFIYVIMLAVARWLGIRELPRDFAADINNDFGISERNAEDIASLLKMVLAGLISHKTFLEEVKRRNLIGELVDIDQEIEESEGTMVT
jgi:hypothetical protein